MLTLWPILTAVVSGIVLEGAVAAVVVDKSVVSILESSCDGVQSPQSFGQLFLMISEYTQAIVFVGHSSGPWSMHGAVVVSFVGSCTGTGTVVLPVL